MVQTSNNTYQQYEAPNVKNSTLAVVIGTDVYFPDFSTGKMTKITSAGVVSTIIIPTVANMKQVITDGTYIYAAGVLNIIIRITTAGVITTVMMTGLANQEYTLGISGAYLFAMPVNSSDYFGVINLSDFTFNRRCEFRNIWSTLRGAGFTYSGDYWLSEGTTQHRINGITQDVISKRNLKEIGSGFVSREVLPDGSVKLLTADGDEFHDSDIQATANKLVLRDASGRAQIANPSVDADIANKGWTRDFVYPVGSYYTQFPGASSNKDSTEFPTTQRPATLFGGTWAEQWATESVYFRTSGTLSDSGRVDGKQKDAFQGHGHKLTTVDPGGGGAISGNVVVANMVSAKVRKVFDSNTPTEGVLEPTTYGTNGTPRTAKETRTVNRRIKVWKRTA